MTIINAQIKGGGTQPTGTKSITSNGVYDVTDFASADVQVPTTAPAYYIEKTVDANGVLKNGASSVLNLNGVTTIDSYALMYAYYGDTNLTGALDLSKIENVYVYGMADTFQGCTGITSVDLSGITTIANYGLAGAFQGCTGITSADLSGIIQTSGNNALAQTFSGCTSLTTVDLSNLRIASGTNALSQTFYGCTSLTSINLNNLETAFMPGAFSYSGLTSITLPKLTFGAINTICSNCQSLTTANISKFEYGSAANAFDGCTNLTTVDLSGYLYGNIYQLFYQAFRNCSSLTSVNLGRPYNTDQASQVFHSAFYGCTSLTSVDIPVVRMPTSGTTNLLYQAFYGCSSLQSVSFPVLPYNNLNYNNSFANMLQGCSGVTVHFPAEWETTMSTWQNVRNGFSGTNTTVLFDLPNITSVNFSYLGENVKYSYPYLYGGCTSITSADLSTITTISVQNGLQGTFSGCTSLATVDISNLTTISGNNGLAATFANTALTSLDLSKLTTITGQNGLNTVCSQCSSLTSVDLSNLTTGTGGGVFLAAFRESGLTSFSAPKLTTVTGSNSFQNTFYGCTSLTSVDLGALDLPESNIDTYYLNNTFYGCTALTNINLSSIRALPRGNSAMYGTFQNCSSLVSIRFDSVNTIYSQFNGTFAGCSRLTDVYLPALKNYNSSYTRYMLNGCTGVTVHVPAGSANLNFGGTNTTILTDLPRAYILLGADGVYYERNPKYDTATALSWRVLNSEVASTPYYTSGTTDPEVGDTLYSDAACTTAVTTISNRS